MKLVGGEHNRLTKTERDVDSVADRCSRLDENAKILKQQLERCQQQFTLQLEELLDTIQVVTLHRLLRHIAYSPLCHAQRQRSVVTSKHAGNHHDFNTVRNELKHLKDACTDRARSFKIETSLLVAELK